MITPGSVPPKLESVARHYDDLDRFYRELWGEHVHHGLWRTGRERAEEAVLDLVREVARLAELSDGHRVCDIGCGYGGPARYLAAHCRVRVEGITLSPVQCAYALQKTHPLVSIRQGDWLCNPYPDASFDAAISLEGSEHMPDITEFFRQAHRVLRPGGRMVVCSWLSREEPASWELRLLLEPICREGRIAQLGTLRETLRWMEEAGFRVEHTEDVSRQVCRTWTICVARLLRGLLKNRDYRRFLFDRRQKNRIFALTLFRIWIAYRTGSMRYGIFKARKP